MRHWNALAPLLGASTAQAGIVDITRVVDEINDAALILGLRKVVRASKATVAIDSDTE